MDKLKPCPFCGDEARIKDGMRTDGNIIYKTKCVQCVGCGAKTQEKISCGYYSLHFTDEEAIEAWNRRKPLEEIVEQLEKYKELECDDIDDDIDEEVEDAEELYELGRSQGKFEAYLNAIEIVKKGGAV